MKFSQTVQYAVRILLVLAGGLLFGTFLAKADTTSREVAKLLPSDGQQEWGFGWSVALDSDTALIGAGDTDSCYYGTCSDGVYVFTRTAEKWSEQTKLIPNDDYIGEGYGQYIALSGDTALIGVPYDDYNGEGSGSVYVFTRVGDTWNQQVKLQPNDPSPWDAFGMAVSIDGNTALIGASGDDDNGDDSGSAYVFVRIGDTWTQQAKLIAVDGRSYDLFGKAVALDGDTAVIGAPNYRPAGFADASGIAYVFTRTGGIWTQDTRLVSDDLAPYDSFGEAVAIDGDKVVIGAPTDHDPAEYDPYGSAYVFTRTGDAWTQQAKLLPSGYSYFSLFGSAVAIHNDKALIGARGWRPESSNGERFGASYLFMQTGSAWPQVERLLERDGEAYNNFGRAVAIQGETALVGAGGSENTEGIRTGAAYVYLFEEPFPWELFLPAILRSANPK